MDMKGAFPIIAAVFIILIVVIGEIVVVTSTHDDFSTSIQVSDDSISYRIESDAAHEYAVVSMMDSLGAPKGVYVYFDPDYKSMSGIGLSATGGWSLDEKYYVEQLSTTFMIRGIDDIKIIDANRMSELMSKSGDGQALIMLSGSLPDTVYDGTSDSLILEWLSSGGRLYWMGNVLGKYMSSGQTVTEIDHGTSLFLGSDDCIDSESHYGDTEIDSNGFHDALYLQTFGTTFAVNTSLLPEDSVYQSIGYTDGVRSSITLVEYADGMVCVIGGEFSIDQRVDLAQVVASGVGPRTVILEDHKGSVQGGLEGAVPKGDSVFIILGGFYTVYCENHGVA